MTAFLLACIVSLQVVLIGLAMTGQNDGWWIVGAPAWMQGIGTLFAAGVAIKALSTWRDQEQSRRTADAAERLWVSLAKVVFTMRACRLPNAINRSVDALDMAVARIVERGLEEHFARLNDYIVTCQFEIVTMEGVFPDELIREALQVCHLALELEDAWKGLQFAASDRISAGDGEIQRRVISESLAKLGLVEEDGPERPFAGVPKVDAFDCQLRKRYENVRKGLRPYVVLSPKAVVPRDIAGLD